MDPPSSYFQIISASLFLALSIVYLIHRSIRSPNGAKTNTNFSTKLMKIPEPKGALPFIGHMHLLGTGKPNCRAFSDMAEKYGPIFNLRIGCHDNIVVSSREIARECLITNDKVFASRPKIAGSRYMGYNYAALAFAPQGDYWREMRKIATTELLSTQRLEKIKHVRDAEIYSFIKDLYSFTSSKSTTTSDSSIQVPITKFIEHLTFNILARVIAGKRFKSDDVIDQADNEAWRLNTALRDATYLLGVLVADDIGIPFLNWFDFQGNVSFMKRTGKEIDFVLDKWLREHMEKKNNKNGAVEENDLMDVLISLFENRDEICGHKRESVIKATAMILIFAGTGSTAITLTWALSLLINHPEVLKAAQQEMDTNIGKDKWVQESDIKGLKYLQAIVKETFRLYPAAPLTAIREAMDDCNLAGYHVRKGTRLHINLWKLHRDPLIWSNPEEFQPERFLTTHADVNFHNQDFGLIPFSFGRRSCPGSSFGLQVLHLTLARLIQGFDICTKGGVPVDMSEGLGLSLPKEKPLEVMLQPRLPLELYENL